MIKSNFKEPNYSKYIGRNYDEYNCLDLVKEFYADIFKLNIKNYYEGDTPDSKQVESLIVSNKGDFIEVKGPVKLGDIVVIKLFGVECHIGVVIDSKRFLHSVKNVGSAMETFNRYSRMISGFYRHRELTP